MIKYAITGNIASGKTAVEKFFRQKGFNVLDTDKVAHDLLENEVLKSVIEAFGEEILTNNKPDRAKLAEIVFKNAEKRKILENIIHPLVKEKILSFFNENESEKAVFVAVPLLFEAGMEHIFDKIILVVADDEIRLERLMARNGLEQNDALRRIKSQMSQFEKFEKSDYVFHNNAEFDNLKNQVDDFCNKILEGQL